MRVLLVEDDAELAGLIAGGLRDRYLNVVVANSFEAGRVAASLQAHDVIVLDVMLPGGSGFDLCRQLRQRGMPTPVLMLTARDAVADRVTGLKAGADDYLTKPFAFQELLARLQALVRRREAVAPRIVALADLQSDLDGRIVTRAGVEIRLTAREFSLFECLALHAGEVVTRQEMSAHVWDENHDPRSNMLEVLISRVRHKVDAGHSRRLIHNVRGLGYRLG